MMTPKRRHSVGPTLLATIGIAVMLIGIGLRWWRPDRYTEIEWVPQLIGAAIAFVGFYAMDPRGAKDGGAFIVDAGTRIVSVIRGGRRATDPPVVTPTAEVPIAAIELPPPEQPDEVPPLGAVPAKERGDL